MGKKESLEKLLNSLGSSLVKKYYGLDLNFEVVSMEPVSASEWDAEIRTDKPIPPILDVKIEPEFKYGKYARIQDIIGNLESLSRYIGIKHLYLSLIDNVYPERWDRMVDKDDYINFPEEYIPLESVGAVVEKDTGYVYTLFNNDTLETKYDIYSLAQIDEEEWWESLSEEDKQQLNDYYGK